MRIAMWSGPRNLSTAMMYSFASRSDCAVWDEPFYAPFLATSGRVDPMRTETLAREEADPVTVASRCLGPVPRNKPVFYQKHMPHHMLPGFPLDWAAEVTNVFLIRHPVRVIESYLKKRSHPNEDDIGFGAQIRLFDQLTKRIGHAPVVIDSSDIRRNPEVMLRALCEAIGLDFDPAMLSWQAGPKPFDGAWAPHWYPEVWNSTGIAPAEGPLPELGAEYDGLLAGALPHYERLAAYALKSPSGS
ncbi:MAG: HAD family hydrolase [Hyphomicrobiaceae bacterium]|nr:HAD family hydrolase [Hyphomicrobiaceae bacterium]